jgi:molybdopterin molybdotransferase
MEGGGRLVNLLSVQDALAQVLSGAEPVGIEQVPLLAGLGRVLAAPVVARRTQPGFDASAMDGYAVRAADALQGARLRVIGEASAGHAFEGAVRRGDAVRIFTGAPVPAGADAVLIQENAAREGDLVQVNLPPRTGQNIRRRGLDFAEGHLALAPGLRLGPRDLAFAAASNHGELIVRRRPLVAILATGDEIVPPGGEPGPFATVASNNFALAAIVAVEGGEVLDLGIAGDDLPSLEGAIRRAREAGADILVTIGGASVGDHDLVQTALAREGMTLGFWRIAMRPGKPMMHGRLGSMHILGLPGNPVSAVVCGILFLVPLIRALSGRRDLVSERLVGRFAVPWPANDHREDYLRATSSVDAETGDVTVTPFEVQDSSMVRVLHEARCLVVRPPDAPAARVGDRCEVIDLCAHGY